MNSPTPCCAPEVPHERPNPPRPVDVHRLVLLPRGEVRVSAPTERDLRLADLSLAFSAGVCAAAVCALVIATFYLRLTC